jgi:hypothetical protein
MGNNPKISQEINGNSLELVANGYFPDGERTP